MLTRLRSRAIDGATMLARYLDARRERDRLRETVEFVCDERDEAIRERDEYARLVATLEVEIDELLRLRREVERLTAERDARIPIDLLAAATWLEARGWWFEREDSSPLSEPWSAYRFTAAEPVLVADTYWWAVLQALGEELSEAWDSAPSPEADA